MAVLIEFNPICAGSITGEGVLVGYRPYLKSTNENILTEDWFRARAIVTIAQKARDYFASVVIYRIIYKS